MTVTCSLLNALLTSPPLVGSLPEADVFDINNVPLPEEFPDLNLAQKLGHLYEDALALLLNSSSRFDLLARNLQIQKDQHTTLGEFDFLLRDQATGQVIHLELATKFYLAVVTNDGLHLPGPDARDHYFKKLDRLRSHQLQLPLLYKEHLPESYRHESIVTQHLIHGCLFDHISTTSAAAPEFIHPDCRRGKWLTSAELPSYFPPDTIFQIIPKPLWPVPLDLLPLLPLDHWSPDTPVTRCLMVRIDNHPTPFFIAPPGYPNQPTSSR